jgi:hypothetical protein
MSYLRYLIQWNKYNVRAVTIFDQRQYTISDDIQLSTIYDYLLYKFVHNNGITMEIKCFKLRPFYFAKGGFYQDFPG